MLAPRVGSESNPLLEGVPCGESATLTNGGVGLRQFQKLTLVLLFLSLMMLYGCKGELVPRDMQSLLIPRLQRSEIFGFVAGFGTTFAAVPDLFAMVRRRSSIGMNPRMAAILAIFQVLWIYYGLLIASRPVIAWNVIAVLINSLSVGAYFHFRRKERKASKPTALEEKSL